MHYSLSFTEILFYSHVPSQAVSGQPDLFIIPFPTLSRGEWELQSLSAMFYHGATRKRSLAYGFIIADFGVDSNLYLQFSRVLYPAEYGSNHVSLR